jgi:sugar lactone lactonase YvrE
MSTGYFTLAALFATAVAATPCRAQSYAFSTLAVPITAVEFDPLNHPANTGVGVNQMNLAADSAGNVFVADTAAHAIKKIAPDGTVTVFAGEPGVAGLVDGIGRAARFHSPRAIALDSAGNLFVADEFNNAIRRIAPTGAVTTLSISTQGPTGLTFDGAGNLYLTDLDPAASVMAPARDAHRLRRVGPAGEVTLVTAGTFGRTWDGNETTNITCDAAGNIYLVNSAEVVIRKVTPAGTVSVFAGKPGYYGTVDGVGDAARFFRPVGIATDGGGNLFVTEAIGTIRQVSLDGRVTTLGGHKFTNGPAADGIGGAARFIGPAGIAVDRSGNLYVGDSGTGSGPVYPGMGAVRKGVPSASPAPPIITDNLFWLIRDVVVGNDTLLTSHVSGSAPMSYQWFKNGVAISGATGATLLLPQVSESDVGDYALTATNAAGSDTQDGGSLQVVTAPVTSFAIRHGISGGDFLWGITVGNGTIVAVGTNGKILSSTDGRTWTQRLSGTSDWLVGVAFAAGKFVVVGDHGTILVSTDGTTWTRATSSGTTQRLNNVTYGGGRYVTVGEAGTIVSSIDAMSWTPAPSTGGAGWLRGLVFDPYTHTFVTTGQGGVVLLSTDGLAWNQLAITGIDTEALAAGEQGNIVGVGQDGSLTRITYQQYTTIFGTFSQWSAVLSSANVAEANVRLRALAVGGGAFFAAGENGTIRTSRSGSYPWAQMQSGTTANLLGGAFVGNTLYLVGENETILQSNELFSSRLINISSRAVVGTGANTLAAGFVIRGDTPKHVLVRAAGPALKAFGIANPVTAPVLTVIDGAGHPIATNSGWDTGGNAASITAADTQVGAFPFTPGSTDAALLVTLNPGDYSATITSKDGNSGLALVEVYDAEALSNSGSRAINISTRAQVSSGDNVLIAGFVIHGDSARRLLIRGVGPSLATFGVPGVLSTPQINVRDSKGALITTIRAWSARPDVDDIRTAQQLTGAFALQEGSADAAAVLQLAPGPYTIEVSGINGASGVAMAEVYDLP